ncbi:nuclear transport factor 2 family protein [Natronomonas marina]|uniref:nuclear transport factor 2 family protein n=1 Tax=Natronomonas marina TaxID=2961939 RepID=UPI0020C9FD05|nr:nuclear transport factor 2 family protein [Natronomonas marina]
MTESDPRAVVEEFFERMSDPETQATVGELFADRAVITRPGRTFVGDTAAEEFVEAVGQRLEWVDKEFDRWIQSGSEVASIGRLYGVNNDGDAFSDVRYIDVYSVSDGEITRLDIWNDLASEGIVEPGA